MDYLVDLIINSGKAWDVAREAGLYVYFHEDCGGHCVTNSAAHDLPSVFPGTYGSQDAAYGAIFTYMGRDRRQ